MRHFIRRVLPVVLLSHGAVAPLGAQRPNFAGTWTRVDPAPARPTVAATGDAAFARGDAGSGWGSPLTITQGAQQLEVEYQVFSTYDLQPPLHLTFALDGSRSMNTMMLSHSEAQLRSSAAWNGDALVITSHYPGPPDANGRPLDVVVTQSLRLTAPDALEVETTRHGILGAASIVTRTAYARK